MTIFRHGIALNCHHNKGSGGVLYLYEWDKAPTGIKLLERNYDLLCRFLCNVENNKENNNEKE